MVKNADQDGPQSAGGERSRAEQLCAAVEGAAAKSTPKSKPKRF